MPIIEPDVKNSPPQPSDHGMIVRVAGSVDIKEANTSNLAKETGGNLADIRNNVIAPQGAVNSGTRDLTLANTWYAVPSTIPTKNYTLIVSIENAVGTIRFSYSNASPPSAAFGNLAPEHLAIKMRANTPIYYASTVAGDDVNWTIIEQV